MKHHTVAQL
jgi:hypothetical protein